MGASSCSLKCPARRINSSATECNSCDEGYSELPLCARCAPQFYRTYNDFTSESMCVRCSSRWVPWTAFALSVLLLSLAGAFLLLRAPTSATDPAEDSGQGLALQSMWYRIATLYNLNGIPYPPIFRSALGWITGVLSFAAAARPECAVNDFGFTKQWILVFVGFLYVCLCALAIDLHRMRGFCGARPTVPLPQSPWVERKDPTGKVYWVHATTGKTSYVNKQAHERRRVFSHICLRSSAKPYPFVSPCALSFFSAPLLQYCLLAVTCMNNEVGTLVFSADPAASCDGPYKILSGILIFVLLTYKFGAALRCCYGVSCDEGADATDGASATALAIPIMARKLFLAADVVRQCVPPISLVSPGGAIAALFILNFIQIFLLCTMMSEAATTPFDDGVSTLFVLLSTVALDGVLARVVAVGPFSSFEGERVGTFLIILCVWLGLKFCSALVCYAPSLIFVYYPITTSEHKTPAHAQGGSRSSDLHAKRFWTVQETQTTRPDSRVDICEALPAHAGGAVPPLLRARPQVPAGAVHQADAVALLSLSGGDVFRAERGVQSPHGAVVPGLSALRRGDPRGVARGGGDEPDPDA
jgi:hypothetical protein